MENLAKKYRVLLVSQIGIVVLLLFNSDLAKHAWLNSFQFTTEILKILPPVLLLIGLLDAWIPKGAVEVYLGKGSGVKGMFLAAVMGSIAAGPLFAAFPIAASFANRGGRVANTVIFLGAWATIKIPMLMMESHFIGLKFSLLRLVLTTPFIILNGLLMEAFLDRRLKPI